MLYRANSDTKQICLRVNRNKQLPCCDNMELRISPLVCKEPPQYEYKYSVCGGVERTEIKREPPLTLVYDMFDRDEFGNVCFLLDSQFAELHCGRYNATLSACGCLVYTFQIDKRDTFAVSHVEMNNQSNCCEGKYGC